MCSIPTLPANPATVNAATQPWSTRLPSRTATIGERRGTAKARRFEINVMFFRLPARNQFTCAIDLIYLRLETKVSFRSSGRMICSNPYVSPSLNCDGPSAGPFIDTQPRHQKNRVRARQAIGLVQTVLSAGGLKTLAHIGFWYISSVIVNYAGEPA